MIMTTSNRPRLTGQIMDRRMALSLFCTDRRETTIHGLKREKAVPRTITSTTTRGASECSEGT